MRADVLSNEVVDALARIDDAIAHASPLQNDLFLLRTQLSTDAITLKNLEKLIHGHERLILDQAERIIVQNIHIKDMEIDLARIQMQHVELQTEYAIEKNRSILSRLLGKFHDP